MTPNVKAILDLADGERSSRQIASMLGLSPRYVRRVLAQWDAPRLTTGAQPGERNHQYIAGRRVDLDGYVLVSVPADKETARRPLPGRKHWAPMLDHRLVMEKTLGRQLEPGEVVDHIDGLTLHNAPENLRLFASNGEHLRQTLEGPQKWSDEGRKNIGARTDRGREIQRIDMYRQRRARGEIRLRQILRAALSLGIDSPYLSGTHHHLEKAGIHDWSRPNLERALADLYREWGWPPPQSE